MKRDLSAILPNGESFDFWEREQVYERELHVDCANPAASDSNNGSFMSPFKTINAAAQAATPGTRVLIHAGTYRETVKPAMGGENAGRMIAYEAAGDGEVIIKASEIATEFELSDEWDLYRDLVEPDEEDKPDIWLTRLDPDKFRGYNPFCAINLIHDRLYIEYGRTDMTNYLNRRGMVFIDGKPLQQVALYSQMANLPGSYWVESNGQIIHFRLPDDTAPSEHLVELTAREQCFAPDKAYLNYIKVKGLTCAHAATGAPVPQRGAISCYRGNHWIIEDCTIDWSNCLGIDVGNECWHRKKAPDKPNGYTILRRNRLYDCGVCGIAGIGAHCLLIEDNLIQGTGWQRLWQSYEAAGIKIHGSVDSLYRRNIIAKYISADAIWMDVNNYNNRVTQNLFVDAINSRGSVFIECSRSGENMIDNNIIWNVEGNFDHVTLPELSGSQGWYEIDERNSVANGFGVYGDGTDEMRISNNLIGKCNCAGYHQNTVAFRMTSRGGTARDNKLYNNIFYDCGEAAIKLTTNENESEGNAFVRMPAGFLRILYPLPTQCLDLEAWQKFRGFDLTGVNADFGIEVDTENYTLTVTQGPAKRSPYVRRFKNILTEPAELPAVKADEKVSIDYFGNELGGEARIAGPFSELKPGLVYNIDPRKL